MEKNINTWLQGHEISVLKWTSSCPDLPSFETIWHNMKKQLHKTPAHTVNELKTTLQAIWDKMLLEDLQISSVQCLMELRWLLLIKAL